MSSSSCSALEWLLWWKVLSRHDQMIEWWYSCWLWWLWQFCSSSSKNRNYRNLIVHYDCPMSSIPFYMITQILQAGVVDLYADADIEFWCKSFVFCDWTGFSWLLSALRETSLVGPDRRRALAPRWNGPSDVYPNLTHWVNSTSIHREGWGKRLISKRSPNRSLTRYINYQRNAATVHDHFCSDCLPSQAALVPKG